jgi:hypothetical protein
MNNESQTKKDTVQTTLEVMRDIFAKVKENIADNYTPREVIGMIESEVDEMLSDVRSTSDNSS